MSTSRFTEVSTNYEAIALFAHQRTETAMYTLSVETSGTVSFSVTHRDRDITASIRLPDIDIPGLIEMLRRANVLVEANQIVKLLSGE